MIDFIRGVDVLDDDGDGDSHRGSRLEARRYLPLHARRRDAAVPTIA